MQNYRKIILFTLLWLLNLEAIAEQPTSPESTVLTIGNDCQTPFWLTLTADPSGEPIEGCPKEIKPNDVLQVKIPPSDLYQNLSINMHSGIIPIPIQNSTFKRHSCHVLIQCKEKGNWFGVTVKNDCPAPDPLKLPVT